MKKIEISEKKCFLTVLVLASVTGRANAEITITDVKKIASSLQALFEEPSVDLFEINIGKGAMK